MNRYLRGIYLRLRYRKDKTPPRPKPAIPSLTLRAPGW